MNKWRCWKPETGPKTYNISHIICTRFCFVCFVLMTSSYFSGPMKWLPWLIWVRSNRPQFYQTRSAWSMDQASTMKRSAVHNFVPTVTKFCVMWEGLSLPHDTKFGNCRGELVDRRVFFIWSLIHGSSWSGLIKVGPDHQATAKYNSTWTVYTFWGRSVDGVLSWSICY